MIYIGIDPGKQGAIATVLASGARSRYVTPLISSPRGRDEYDLSGIAQLLRFFRDVFGGVSMVTIEKQQPMPLAKGGTIANYNRGVASGWAWMLTALELPYQLVSPQAWQKEMLAGVPGDDTGQRSIIAAQRLFPGVDLLRTPRSRKPCDGISDALLLAEWGRRRHVGAARATD